MRSLIIAPGDDEARLQAALESGADAVIIDLVVAPESRPAARANAARLLAKAQVLAPALMVRVSPLERFVPLRSLGSVSSPLVGEDGGGGSRRPMGQASSDAFKNLPDPGDPPPLPAPTSGGGCANAIDSTKMQQALGDAETDCDLEAVMGQAPFAIVLPQALKASVQQLSTRLAVCEARSGLEDGSTRIVAVADTAAALIGLAGAKDMSARLIGLAWDAEALRVDIGAETCRDESGVYSGPYRLARDLTLLAATAAGIAAIDAASTDIQNPEQLRAEALAARSDGFAAKLAADPGQAKIINDAFGARR